MNVNIFFMGVQWLALASQQEGFRFESLEAQVLFCVEFTGYPCVCMGSLPQSKDEH